MIFVPYLLHNGAEDPDRWQPDRQNLRESWGVARPDVGDLVGWRYAAWRVHDIRPYKDVDLSGEQKATLDKAVAALPRDQQPIGHAKLWPFHLVLRHHNGPLIVKPGEGRGFKRLHDGTQEVSFTSWPHQHKWMVLTDPYQTCSCHGHIWPCQEIDRSAVAAQQADKMSRLMATTEPGVCAACLEPITTRQKTLTFPEPSRLVPGAPGPTFHAGRADCWAAAEEYERSGRLADNPDVTRLASCPGVRFVHESQALSGADRLDCTAGPLCTGLHGPPGYRADPPCWHRVQLAAGEGAYARPGFDCGYRSGMRGDCLGSDLSSGGGSLSPIAGDLLWDLRQRSRHGGLL